MTKKDYYTVAETARIIRKQLKKNFADTKFYVQSSSYASGASIDIHWMDGPSDNQVDELVQGYSGKGFDSMIDLAYYYDAYINEKDEVVKIATGGTTGSAGTHEAIVVDEKEVAHLRKVHFSADHIFTNRATSRALVERVAIVCSKKIGWDAPDIVDQAWFPGRKQKGDKASFSTGLSYDRDSDWTLRQFNSFLNETSMIELDALEVKQASDEQEANQKSNQDKVENMTVDQLDALLELMRESYLTLNDDERDFWQRACSELQKRSDASEEEATTEETAVLEEEAQQVEETAQLDDTEALLDDFVEMSVEVDVDDDVENLDHIWTSQLVTMRDLMTEKFFELNDDEKTFLRKVCGEIVMREIEEAARTAKINKFANLSNVELAQRVKIGAQDSPGMNADEFADFIDACNELERRLS